MQKVRVIVIGAGNRGNQYALYSKYFPREMEIVGVAEPNETRRRRFALKYHLKKDRVCENWEEALNKEKAADAVIICTQDTMHIEPFLAAERAGYHILLEKPMATTEEDCKTIAQLSEKSDKVMAICHVLRYTPYFLKIKKIIDSGVLGEVIAVNHLEAIGHKHFAHSYVRGNWRRKDESGPLSLTKACHDFDIINWLIAKKCMEVSSFGELKYFKPENAPKDAGIRCLSCKIARVCPYDAKKIYLKPDKLGWPTTVVTKDMSQKGIIKALEEGPYGRCVYSCDNDVVDHQNTILKYEDGVTASINISAFTAGDIVGKRFTRIMGSHGELTGDFEQINISDFRSGRGRSYKINLKAIDKKCHHGGGDFGLIREFISAINTKSQIAGLAEGLSSHLQAFAAEDSRRFNIPINLS